MPIEITSDGTHTILSEKYAVPYHSIHGALQETNHVFIDAGLRYISAQKEKEHIRILEVGFGTGLNVLATLAYSRNYTQSIDIQSIEAYPITLETADKLNYGDYIDLIDKEDLLGLHTSKWSSPIAIDEIFTFTKFQVRLEDFDSDDLFDVIYFDAFAPTAQPELWSPVILQKMFDLLSNHGVLVTYCAKGQFKRDLKSVGFEVEAIPGPPRKREMTRAIKRI